MQIFNLPTNMKKLLLSLCLMASTAHASELIYIQSPYGAGHGGTASEFRILEQANKSQSKYNFVLEFKPGAQQTLALKAVDTDPQKKLGIVAASIVENNRAKTINSADYIPIAGLGDACWVVVANVGDQQQGLDSLRDVRKTKDELVIGGVAFGNAAHLTGLQIAEKYGFKVRYIPFKSNPEALMQGMVASEGVNLVVVQVKDFETFKPKQDKLQMLAASCPTRIPKAPNIKTLAEQGIRSPYIFNAVVAHKDMDPARREELSKILLQATKDVGEKTIAELSDMKPPMFRGLTISKWYTDTYTLVDELLDKYNLAIEKNRRGESSN